MSERMLVSVTFDPNKSFVGIADGLRSPVIALSLGGLRRRIESLMMPDTVEIRLELDRKARLERDQRRHGGHDGGQW
jgi:hypothetical protein